MPTIIHSEADGNPFFDGWMQGWSRKLVLARELATCRVQIANSARQMEHGRGQEGPLDLFPSCVLALALTEGLSVDDMVILLDQSPELIRKGLAEGLRRSSMGNSRLMGEIQHA